MKTSEKLRQADESQDDLTVGEILAYPGCCINSFMSETGSGDPVSNSSKVDGLAMAYVGHAYDSTFKTSCSILGR